VPRVGFAEVGSTTVEFPEMSDLLRSQRGPTLGRAVSAGLTEIGYGTRSATVPTVLAELIELGYSTSPGTSTSRGGRLQMRSATVLPSATIQGRLQYLQYCRLQYYPRLKYEVGYISTCTSGHPMSEYCSTGRISTRPSATVLIRSEVVLQHVVVLVLHSTNQIRGGLIGSEYYGTGRIVRVLHSLEVLFY